MRLRLRPTRSANKSFNSERQQHNHAGNQRHGVQRGNHPHHPARGVGIKRQAHHPVQRIDQISQPRGLHLSSLHTAISLQRGQIVARCSMIMLIRSRRVQLPTEPLRQVFGSLELQLKIAASSRMLLQSASDEGGHLVQ
jgi:hypothetical protein